MTLALVAPTFNAISETFIADHVRTLAPGRTVLVCGDSRGADLFGCPVLSHVQPAFASFGPLDFRIKDLCFRLRRRYGPSLGFEGRMRLIEFFRTQRVDRVLAEFGHSGAQVADVCARLGLPLFVYFRGSDASASIRERAVRRRYRRMFGQVRAIFCVSQHLADRLVEIGCPADLIHINPSGALISAFPPGRPEPGRMLAVGRLVEKKAPHLTIEAFAGVAERFPAARLDMVGDGPLVGRCFETIARRGVADRVTMHGSLPHDEVARLMRRASVFVQHSLVAPNGDIEGFPTAIAEAMSTALPVISTRHSGIAEHVTDGESGLIVAEGDVAGMAAAMARVLADPGYARSLGAAARAHAIRSLDRVRARERVREVMGLPDPDAVVQPILKPQKVV
jgi:colanic acid/amylovoran biosynthesis glycosyltransferase